MKKFLTIALAAMALALAVSCDKFNILYGNYKAMVEISDRLTFIADDGSVFRMVENMAGNEYASCRRALIVCDVLEQNADGSYNIRLLSYTAAYTRDAVKISTADPAVTGEDAVDVCECTCTPDYITAVVNYIGKSASDTRHTMDMVFDDVKSNADTSFFVLCHNGFGETYSNPDISVTDLELHQALVSFNIKEVRPDVNKKMVFAITWNWHKTDAASEFFELSREMEPHTGYTSVQLR